MGQTNREKFENLLDEVNNQQSNTDDWNNNSQKSDNNSQEESSSDQLSIIENSETSHRLTDYIASWKAVTDQNISREILNRKDKTHTDLSDVEIPVSSNPSAKEIGRFLYLLEQCQHVLLPSKADRNQMSIADVTSKPYSFTFENQFGTHMDTIKLVASVLENQSIQWTLSEITEKHKEVGNLHHVIVEAGVPEDGENSQEEFIEELQSVMPETVSDRTIYIESTHCENGYSFYPVYGQFQTVQHPGIFRGYETISNGVSQDKIKHRGTIKSSFF
jgi:hypothetical protein